jgi:hypothetical protein
MAGQLMLINPIKHKKKSTKKKKAKKHHKKPRALITKLKKRSIYMTNPRKRHYKRNPIGGMKPMAFIKSTMMPSAIGAAGALGLDMALAYVPLPDMLKTDTMKPIVRIAGAVAIGMLAGMVTNRRMGEQVGAGALTVVLYDTLKGFVKTSMPTLNLGEMPSDYGQMEYLAPAPAVGMGEYVDSNMGEYVF